MLPLDLNKCLVCGFDFAEYKDRLEIYFTGLKVIHREDMSPKSFHPIYYPVLICPRCHIIRFDFPTRPLELRYGERPK